MAKTTPQLLIKTARVLANPARLYRRALMRWSDSLSLETRVSLDLYERPHYAYGVSAAADQARALSLPAISVVELGVGTGQGLLALEAVAREIAAATGVEIRVYGFDAGGGLPRPADYRDLPYLYQGGYYAMDEPALRARLDAAELVIGNVAETVPGFCDSAHPPLGFIAFDLDYYTSTMDSFALLSEDESCLPRVLCYFDDVGNADALQSRFSGEELAIDEFNESNAKKKIGRVRGLAASRAIPAAWNEQMYVCHLFEHPLYDRHVVADAGAYVTPLDR